MWSESFTGRRGVVADSFQRIGLKMTAAAFLQYHNSVVKELLRKCTLLHIALETNQTTAPGVESLVQKMISLRDAVSVDNHRRLVYTILHSGECSAAECEFFRRLKDSDLLTCLSLVYQGSREASASAIVRLTGLLSKQVHLGLHGFPEDEYQWILSKSEECHSIAYMGDCFPPNLRMRQIDFSMSRLCNVIVSIPPNFDKNSAELNYLRALSEKYKRPMSVVLAKALLQIGIIVLFDLSWGEEFLESDAFRLSHPFTYRHTSLAPTAVKNFVIEDSDVHIIIAASELVETKPDALTKADACIHAPHRELTYEIPVFRKGVIPPPPPRVKLVAPMSIYKSSSGSISSANASQTRPPLFNQKDEICDPDSASVSSTEYTLLPPKKVAMLEEDPFPLKDDKDQEAPLAATQLESQEDDPGEAAEDIGELPDEDC
jgi:hypothetical protein